MDAYRAAGLPERELQTLIMARQAKEQADYLEWVAANTFSVLPENWAALQLLAACSACWQYGMDGKPNGFRYTDAALVARWQDQETGLERLSLAVNAIL